MGMQNHSEEARREKEWESNFAALAISPKPVLSVHSTAECTTTSSNLLEFVCFTLKHCLRSAWSFGEN